MDLEAKKIDELKTMPNDLDAERGILGSILIDPESINQIIDYITEDDFYRTAHKEIFKAMKELYIENETIDIITLKNKLEEKKLLEKCGGISYLTDLIENTITSAHILDYGKIVYEKKILRELIQNTYEILNKCYNPDKSAEEILDEAEKLIFKITQKSSSKKLINIQSFIQEEFEKILTLTEKKEDIVKGLFTGFRDLDNILGGFHRSDLIILGARPSIGKTAFALNIAKNIAIDKKRVVGIFSLEMSKEQLVDRLLAQVGNINLWKLRIGKLSQAEIKNLNNALNELYSAPIYIDDSPNLNVFQIRGMARRLKAEKGLDLLIIDYLQLMSPASPKENEVQQISEISRGLKALARELDIPVITISQLSRRTEYRKNARPRLSDLRQSGSIEQDADVVIFLHKKKTQEDPVEEGLIEVIIAKHRNGPTGSVKLYFDKTTTSFESLTEEYE